jgi:hypothetical protein
MSENKSATRIVLLVIIILTLATAVIHFRLAFPKLIFILNAIGYVGLLGLFLLPQLRKYRPITRILLMGFTAITIIAWVAIGPRMSIAYIDKAMEIVLILALIIDMRLERPRLAQEV